MDSSFDIQLAIIWYLIFLFSTTAHEASHVTGRIKYRQYGRIQNQPVNFSLSYGFAA
jgi:hypothetical protein